MAIWVQTRTFFVLAALLGRFVTVKAQEEDDYDGGEFLSLPLKKKKKDPHPPSFVRGALTVRFG